MPAVTPGPWVLTCDPGIDDAVGLAVAAGRSDCRVDAIVAGAGNVSAAIAWRNAAGLAQLFDLDVAVGIGSAVTTGGAVIHRPGDRHGVDGLAGLSDRLPPVRGSPADGVPMVQGNVVATGPLTDVALARRAGQTLERVVWMGGRLPAPAGATPAAAPEFNSDADPGAVDLVLESAADVSIVPIDVTRRVTFTVDDVAPWRAGGVAARFCADLVARAPTVGRQDAALLHDPVTVLAALEPDLFRWEARRLRCQTPGGAAEGSLVEVEGPPNARVAVDVDAPAVRMQIVDAVLSCGASPTEATRRR